MLPIISTTSELALLHIFLLVEIKSTHHFVKTSNLTTSLVHIAPKIISSHGTWVHAARCHIKSTIRHQKHFISIHKPTRGTLQFEEDRYQDLVHADKFVVEEWIHVGKDPSDASCTPFAAASVANSVAAEPALATCRLVALFAST